MRRLEKLYTRRKIMNNEKFEDGIYTELFVVKDGERYNLKVVTIKEMSNMLVEALMNGIEELVKL